MCYNLAVFSSITLANKIKIHFSKYGYYMALLHAPTSLTEGCCAYCLRFNSNLLYDIKDACDNFSIPIKGVYKEVEENHFEKIDL